MLLNLVEELALPETTKKNMKQISKSGKAVKQHGSNKNLLEVLKTTVLTINKAYVKEAQEVQLEQTRAVSQKAKGSVEFSKTAIRYVISKFSVNQYATY